MLSLTLVLLVLLVLVGLALVFGTGRARRGPGRAARLEEEFLRLSRLPAKEAEALLERTLADLERRFPGRSRAWKLEKAIYDLRRDTR